MTQTVAQVVQYVAEKSGSDLSVMSGLALVNSTGEWLTSTHSWRFLEGRSATVGVVASQNYSVLPTDFAAFIAQAATDGVVNSLQETTLQELLELRSNNVLGNTGNYWFTVTHDTTTAGPPLPRMELDPTPTTTDATAFTIIYRAAWNTLTTDVEKLTLPTFMDGLFLECCYAFYEGMEESDERGHVSDALGRIRNGTLFDAAQRRDGRIQPSYGRIKGGYVRDSRAGYRPYLNSTVAGPS